MNGEIKKEIAIKWSPKVNVPEDKLVVSGMARLRRDKGGIKRDRSPAPSRRQSSDADGW